LYPGEAAAYVRICDSILVIQNTKTGIDSQRTYPLHHPINEPFLTGYAVAPLRNMGQLIGIVEVFSKKEINWNRENVQFFEALAKQTAIAIDKVSMVINLKKSNIDLIHSYEQTLEGWSRAMDIRDHETENHTQRVTSMTMKMGKKFRLTEEQLVQMRRGALLHDIGKLGVPDNILLKTGSLTEEEWQIMRQHPIMARELISPIAFLTPAMSIPYFHHEKWDGSGYPQGLRGGEIPIEARIFSIVDVWDALTSDRPYRLALSPVEAATYIISQSNLHFDPQIVAVFLELLQDEGFLTRDDLFQIHSKDN
jgi:HD-GYP domain-containing protein (c-di-GMP phosphodiesterase class II)